MEPTLTQETLKPGTKVVGTVRHVTLYGALINIGAEQDALLHISQLENTDFRNLEDVMKPGEPVEAYVLKVDPITLRVALTMVKPPELPWDVIKSGGVYKGTVTRIEKFGAFIDIGAERPGMVHVSEMADGYVGAPSDVVKVGDEVEVRVIKLNRKRRQIDLSMKSPKEEMVIETEPEEKMPTAMELALRRARAMSETRTETRPDVRTDARALADELRRSKTRNKTDQDDIMSRTLRNHSNK